MHSGFGRRWINRICELSRMLWGSDHRWVEDVIEHVLPVFKQNNSEGTSQLVEVLFSGGKLSVSKRLIEPVRKL